MKRQIEIMAPAGSYEALQAAIKAGANSIYFGVGELNMRARSASFGLDDLSKVISICKENEVRSYLTLNTVMYDDNLEVMKKICDEAKQAGITAVIASDMAVIQYANSIDLEVHISTQTNVSNIEAVKFFAKYADVIVLARELSLEQIKFICDKIKEEKIVGPSGKLVEIELFAHGALCVSVSGKCYMSLAQYNFSANRGACLQACRRSYRVTDEETGDELKVENKFVMSPKDLCTIKFLDKILDSGVSVLKIEGRGRAPEYVYTTTKVYREAADAYLSGEFCNNGKCSNEEREKKKEIQEKVDNWVKYLGSVFNRGFWHGGYYLGKKLGEWAGVYGSKATKEKVYLGYVKNYFQKVNVAEICLEAAEIKVGDGLVIIGPTSGVVKVEVNELRLSEGNVSVEEVKAKDNKTGESNAGTKNVKKEVGITIPVTEKVRVNDKVYLWVNRKE